MILLDTGPVVALCDPRDRLNARALRDLDRLAKRTLAVQEPVLTEACFHLPHPVQRDRLERLLVDLAIETHVADDAPAFRSAVLGWLRRYAQHTPDWADACLAVAAGRDRSLRVWTYDDEFRSIWRRPDGTRIPLAVPMG